MNFSRSSGILLHPTSLPGPYGIGELGPQAYRWIDWLSEAGCALWQVLPLGPTGYGDSPYQCFSSFAGNPYLISVHRLLEDGLLVEDDLSGMPAFSPQAVDFGAIYHWKPALLNRAFDRFQARGGALSAAFQEFQHAQAHWLPDFALFMALKEAHGGAPWNEWGPTLRQRDPKALALARKAHARAIERQAFRQFLFFRQWADVRAYANRKGVQIIGDIPIFVAYDSADVWAHPELFYLDDEGRPTVVAGVPPDYFSATGQLWGNPLYRWEVHAQSGYAWWLERVRAVLGLVDIIRLDHFRGFYDYWEIPAGAQTAIQGRWVPGPREQFFDALVAALGEDLPIIAEDLGDLTPGVLELRDRYHLPGMKILVFAFYDDPANPFLPHNHTPNCVVYTGTHDNDTARGWYERVDERERDFARRYLARDGHDIAWDLIRAAWGSPGVFALAPMQDLLSLGNEARMNYPGRPSGNWAWRVDESAFTPALQARLSEVNFLYNRHRGWQQWKAQQAQA